jgi:peptidyl-prolyl cis-trans isomerase A (cyclophilin A)
MKRRSLLAAALLALAAAPAMAQPAQTPAAPAPAGPRVELVTPQGRIVVEVYPDKAPVTAGNFLRYVDRKLYDGATFYRANRATGAPEYGMVQGGFNDMPGKKLPPIAHEPTSKTGLKHVDGAISVGRFAPGTATSEFFICVGDMPYLDADPKAKGDNQGFAAFGRVVEGMDVVKKILALPTSPTAGSPVMRGSILLKPVPITRARRVAAG